MITSKLLLSVSVLAIFVFSMVFVAIPITPHASAQQKAPGANWLYTNGDPFASGFNPQTQITKDNAKFLEIKWVFPLPKAPASPGAGIGSPEGSSAQPLIIDGIAYIITHHGIIYALKVADGSVVWNYQYQVDVKNYEKLAAKPIGGLEIHSHGISYYPKTDLLYWSTPDCQIVGVDRLTGKEKFKLAEPWCQNVPGNVGNYKGHQSYGPSFYEKGNLFIFGTGQPEGTGGGRGFLGGWDATTGKLLWRFFLSPPAAPTRGVPADPDWALRDADKGWIRGVRTSEIAKKCPECLKNDWGDAWGQTAGIGWGQWPVDEETGIVYMATNQPSPYTNATYRPGPNLYSTSVIALKAATGELVWYHQTSPHDLWDWDCAWNVVLGKVTVAGQSKKAIFKGCKHGYLHAFDAATGQAFWIIDTSTTISGPNARCANCQLLDASNLNQMRKRWPTEPDTKFFVQCPAITGSIESDIAYAYDTIFVAVINSCHGYSFTPVEWGTFNMRGRTDITNVGVPNATIAAIDANTGKVKWKFFIDRVSFRGGLHVSNGILFTPSANGNLYMLDTETGKLLSNKFMGVALPTPPAIGMTVDGKVRLIQVLSGASGTQQPSPGAIIAYGLPDDLPQPVTKEVIKEVTKEIIKEVPKEVTKTVTVETISPITYAILGVSVILVVVAGVLFSRRKKA